MSFNKEIWGNTIWYLFHTIAHKIKENEFNNIKKDIIFLIKIICSTLPCPECSKDATDILNKINMDNISSKKELKSFLYNFHNYINKKLNKPIFLETDLDSKYSKGNIYNLYNNFYIIYSSNTNIPQLMNSSFQRQYNLPKIKNILDNLLNYYE